MPKYGSVKTEGDSKEPIITSPLKDGSLMAKNIIQNEPFTFWGVIANNGSGFEHGIWSKGDLEIIVPLKGLILRSANGKRFRITVANNGSLKTAEVI